LAAKSKYGRLLGADAVRQQDRGDGGQQQQQQRQQVVVV
jgi:hypothetical protein